MLGFATALCTLRLLGAIDAEATVSQTPTVGAIQTSGVTPTESTVSSTVAPSIGVESTTTLGTRFSAGYSPRALWRWGATTSTGAEPLLLHLLHLNYRPLNRTRTQLDLQAAGSIGDVDTGAQTQVFTNNETAPLSADLRLYNASLTASVAHTLSPRWQWQMTLPVNIQGPLGETQSSDTNQPLLQTSRSAGLSTSLGHNLSLTRALQFSVNSQLAEFQDTLSLSTAALIGWQQRMSRLSSLGIGLGAGRLTLLDRGDDPIVANTAQTQDSSYFLAGSASVAHRSQHGSESLAFTLDARVDPFTQALRPTAFLNFDANRNLSARTSVSASLGASTVTSFEALDTDPNETGVNAAVGLGWTRNSMTLRSGLRGSLRGPNLDPDRADGFKIREKLLAFFVGINWGVLGTRR